MFNGGIRGKRANDNQGTVNPQSKFIQTKTPQPNITGYTISGVDDTALDPAGGQTVLVNGTGFASGVSATLAGTQIASVTLVSPTQISFTAPAKSGGSYALVVYNSSGGAAILVPGLTYSSVPTYTTSAGSIGSYYESTAISTSVTATSDSAITYSLSSGSLPSGATLSSSGTITGTSPADSSSTTYTFGITATDAELQDVTRTFTLTINTDVVSWTNPSSNTSVSLDGTAYSNVLSASSAAGQSITYTANSLPTGLSLSSATISGTPTVEGTTTTLLTATAAITNRSSQRTITWTVSLTDTYWKYTSLLLSADSSIETQSFVADNSLNNSQLTVAGDTRAQNFNPYQLGYYSSNFFTSGDYLAAASNTNLAFGTSDFTVEGWFNFSDVTALSFLFDFRPGSNGLYPVMYLNNGMLVYTVNGSTLINPTPGVVSKVWYHIALVRISSSTKLYLNGTQVGSTYSDTNNYLQSGVSLGVNTASLATGPFLGYMSNFRVVKGTGVYTTTFTPPTTPLLAISGTQLLMCQSNRFIDSSSNNLTITRTGTPSIISTHPFTTVYQAGTQYYSTYFDGSGDYLTTTVPAMSGDFTIECWIYPITTSGYPALMTHPDYTQFEWQFGGGTYSSMGLWFGGSQLNSSVSISNLTLNQWNHMTVVRSGTGSNNIKLYCNGVSFASGTSTATVASATYYIGAEDSTHNPYKGHISNFRIVTGQALYTGTFTPNATSPLTTTTVGSSGTNIAASLTGTVVLLTCQNNTTKDNSANAYTISAYGDTKPLAVSPFTPNSYSNTQVTTYGSGYFDGTGDYITIPYVPSQFDWWVGDYTLEFWVNPQSLSNANAIVGNMNPLASAGNYWCMGLNSSGQIAFYYYNGSGVTLTGTTTSVTINAWTHLSVVKKSSNILLFTNGILQSTTAVSGTPQSSTTVPLTIGGYNTTNLLTGYLSDLRITKGTALYTSNFVPGFTSPLTNVTNTQLLTLQTNGSHNNSVFKDNSSFNNVVTRSGNVNNGTFSPYGDNFSNYFDGSTTYYYPGSTLLNPAAGAFTIEGWVNIPTGTNNKQIFNGSVLVGTGGYSGSTVGALRFYDGSVLTAVGSSSYLIATGTWNHFAVVREGTGSNQFRMYVNGILVYVGTCATTPTNHDTYIGAVNSSTDLITGYISNLRFVKGTAVYTTSSTTIGEQIFTPSTSPLPAIANTQLLICQSNRLTDNSPNYLTPTIAAGTVTVQKFSPFSAVTVPKYYSAYFDGSTDYLSIPASSNFQFTGDFTIEAWIYMSSLPSTGTQRYIVSSYNAGGAARSFVFMAKESSGQQLMMWLSSDGSSGNSQSVSANWSPSANTWYHVAAVRSGTTVTIYSNGVSVGSGSLTTSAFLPTAPIYVGADYALSAVFFGGYISNMRVVKGTAVYTSTFTPSTTPLTAIANTSLLTCQSNTFIDNSTNNFTITAGTATVKPLLVSPFTPTASLSTSYTPTTVGGSMYFDGTGDYLTTPQNSFGTYNFTIECWSYLTSRVTTTPAIFSNYSTWTTGALALFAGHASAASQYYQVSSNGTFPAINAGTIVYNQWTHLALVRNGNTLALYVNGVSVGTANVSGVSYTGVGSSMYIGTAGDAISTGYIQGYLSDFKITKSAALYTTTFYPGLTPATPTTTIGTSTYSSTLLLTGTSGGVVDATRTVDLETIGDAKVTNFSPYNGSYYSNYFNGTTDYLTVANSTALNFGSGSWTIEMWINPTGNYTTYNTLFAKRNDTTLCAYEGYMLPTSGYLGYYNGTLYSSSTAPTTGVWSHIAYVYNGTNIQIYLNGTLILNQATTNTDRAVDLYIGIYNRSGTPYDYYYGNISNFRLVKGQALYTGSFTPSTSPLTSASVGTSGANVAASITGSVNLLTCQSNKFVDNSSNAFTITRTGSIKVQTQNPFQINSGLSYYFDGTGDYLKSANIDSIRFGSAEFTIEFWFYPTVQDAAMVLISSKTDGTQTGDLDVRTDYIAAASTPIYVQAGGASFTATYTGNLINKWTHFALVRSGSTVTMYANGTSIGSGSGTTQGTTYFGAINIAGGSGLPAAGYGGVTGYLSDFRITKGYARYTTTFTPPTSSAKTN